MLYCRSKSRVRHFEARPKIEENRKQKQYQKEVDLGTALGRLWDGFGEDFGRLGRSWGDKREARGRKRGGKKGRTKQTQKKTAPW